MLMILSIVVNSGHYIHLEPWMWSLKFTMLKTDLLPTRTALAQPGAIFAMGIKSRALASFTQVCGRDQA